MLHVSIVQCVLFVYKFNLVLAYTHRCERRKTQKNILQESKKSKGPTLTIKYNQRTQKTHTQDGALLDAARQP